MEKPKCTKQLAFIAMLFVGANFLLNVIVILFPELYIWLFGAKNETTLPIQIQLLLFADAANVLPLGAVCFWNWRQSGISENRAMGTLVLTVICYIARLIGSTLWHYLAVKMANRAAEFSVYAYINNARGIFSFCILAAQVLICCAASIELYITRSLNAKQYKEEHP